MARLAQVVLQTKLPSRVSMARSSRALMRGMTQSWSIRMYLNVFQNKGGIVAQCRKLLLKLSLLFLMSIFMRNLR
jgi:hypothetical protein